MSHEDADPDEDLSLSSMRSLWRSMPDEEPPSGGLASLMAAARMKADEMKAGQASPAAVTSPAVTSPAEPAPAASTSPPREHPAGADRPSWWQRLLSSLQRPPVLALATVTLLVGGAVLIGQRRDQMDAHPQVVQEQEAPGAPARAEREGAQSARDQADFVASGAAELAPASSAEGAPAAPAEATSTGNAAVGGGASPSAPAQPTATMRRPTKAATSKQAPRQPSGPTAATQEDAQVLLDGMASGAGGLQVEETTARETTKTAVARDDVGTEGTPVTRLHVQAQAAAARGDCTRARALVLQIERRDPAYHRVKVASDPTLAGCLAK